MAASNRVKTVTDHLARMLVYHLTTHVFKGVEETNMASRLGVSGHIIQAPWWGDIPAICAASSLDIGLAIRDQKGNEVTLWPSDNIGTAAAPRKFARAKPASMPTVLDAHRTRPHAAMRHKTRLGNT